MNKRTTRNIFIVAVILATTVSAFGFMVYQVVQQGSSLTDQIVVLEKQQSQETGNLQLQRLSEDTFENREKLKDYFLASESSSIDFLNQVETLAPKFDLDLKTSNLNIVANEEQGKWVEVAFEFTGSREKIQSFIELLEVLPYVLRINEVDLKEVSADEWGAGVTMQVQVLSYEK